MIFAEETRVESNQTRQIGLLWDEISALTMKRADGSPPPFKEP
jgi:hypothetical protein